MEVVFWKFQKLMSFLIKEIFSIIAMVAMDDFNEEKGKRKTKKNRNIYVLSRYKLLLKKLKSIVYLFPNYNSALRCCYKSFYFQLIPLKNATAVAQLVIFDSTE
jgi:hypothetical protein